MTRPLVALLVLLATPAVAAGEDAPRAIALPASRILPEVGPALDVGPGCWLREDVCVSSARNAKACEERLGLVETAFVQQESKFSARALVFTAAGAFAVGAATTYLLMR